MSDLPPNLPPAGWYPNAQDASQERWWDGSAWSDQSRPVAATPPAAPVSTATLNPPVLTPTEAPAPFAPVYATQTKRGSGLGLAALIIGVVAFIGAFIPFINYVSGVLALVGLVLGVIGLVQKNRNKSLAIAGAILSVVAIILSIALAIVYTAGFASSVNDAVNSKPIAGTSTDAATNGPAKSPSDAVGTRDKPAPIGSTVTLTEVGVPKWEVTLLAPTLNADAIVAKANQFNDPAPAGEQWAIIPVQVKYLGDDNSSPAFDISVKFVAADGTTHESFDNLAVIDDEFTSINDLYTGASAQGNIGIAIPTADAEKGTWVVSSLFGDDYYYAAQ